MSNLYIGRDIELKSLGFASYIEYLESPLWEIIRKGVLHRDKCRCRNLRCEKQLKRIDTRKEVHHLAYSRAALLGVNPSVLVTLCPDCHHYVEYSDDKLLNSKLIQARTIYLVSGTRQNPGVKNYKISEWYQNSYSTSEATAKRIFDLVLKYQPAWAKFIIKDLADKTLPISFARYIGAENLLKTYRRNLRALRPLLGRL